MRRLLVFQFKLALDGIRDLLLSPISLIAVLAGMAGGGARPDEHFRRLLDFGRRTDRWIDLFDAHPNDGADAFADQDMAAPQDPQGSASAVFDAVERIVREEYARGGGLAGIEARVRSLRSTQNNAGPPVTTPEDGTRGQAHGHGEGASESPVTQASVTDKPGGQ